MYNTIAPTVGAIILGIAGLAVLGLGLFRPGSSVQQLRWLIHWFGAIMMALVYGSIALHQPIATVPEGSGSKPVLWALPTARAVHNTIVTLIVCLGIFKGMGARILPAALTLLSLASLAAGIYLDGFDLWYWFIVSVLLYVLFIAAILFVDRLDSVLNVVTRKNSSQESSGWPGLVWRILLIVFFAAYLVMWALDRYAGAVFTNYTVSLILNVILDIGFTVFAFLCYYLVTPAGPVAVASEQQFREDAESGLLAAPPGGPAAPQAPIGNSINGSSSTNVRQRPATTHNGTANGYSILTSGRQ